MNSNVEEMRQDKGVKLVEMYASWCPHCQAMMPVIDEVKKEITGIANVYQFDIDKFKSLADQLQVDVIPTLIVYRDNKVVWRHEGEIPGEDIVAQIKAAAN